MFANLVFCVSVCLLLIASNNVNALPGLSNIWRNHQSSKHGNSLANSLALLPRQSHKSMKEMEISSDIQLQLSSPEFDNWKYNEEQLPALIEFMFQDLGIQQAFDIDKQKFSKWLLTVESYYHRDIPFHNFQHAFAVTQMMYSLIKKLRLQDHMSSMDLFVMMFSAVTHDLDHPGLTNSFQINAHTDLAIVTNDQSPLERHHSAMAFAILKEPGCDIIAAADERFKQFRMGSIALIMATDLSKHHQIIDRVERKILEPRLSIAEVINDPELKLLLMKLLMKAADLQARPYENFMRWSYLLYSQEFRLQTELEQQMNLPLSMPDMDHVLSRGERDAQSAKFIAGGLLPVYETVADIFPDDGRQFLEIIEDTLHQCF